MATGAANGAPVVARGARYDWYVLGVARSEAIGITS